MSTLFDNREMRQNKMRRVRNAWVTAAATTVCLIGTAAFAAADEPVLYGRHRTSVTAGSYDALGFSVETLVKGDWVPSDQVRFHAEAAVTGTWGSANRYARLLAENLLPLDQRLYPTENFHLSVEPRQVWAAVPLGPFDVTAGLQPLAWGTGYLFNPTSVVYPPVFPGEDLEEVPSTAALSVSLALPFPVGVSGYLAFEDRLRTPVSEISEGLPARLPFGVKLQAFPAGTDLSLSFFREVSSYAAGEKIDRIGADAAGFLGPLGWYAEAALMLPESGSGGYDLGAIEPKDHLSACVGGQYTVPGLEVALRAEYGHLGDGAGSKDEYAWAELLQGRRVLLAEDYLFGSAERTFGNEWSAAVGSLVNLTERGVAFIGEFVWSPEPSLELSLSGIAYAGPEGGEMDGKVPIGPGLYADLTRPELSLHLTVYF